MSIFSSLYSIWSASCGKIPASVSRLLRKRHLKFTFCKYVSFRQHGMYLIFYCNPALGLGYAGCNLKTNLTDKHLNTKMNVISFKSLYLLTVTFSSHSWSDKLAWQMRIADRSNSCQWVATWQQPLCLMYGCQKKFVRLLHARTINIQALSNSVLHKNNCVLLLW